MKLYSSNKFNSIGTSLPLILVVSVILMISINLLVSFSYARLIHNLSAPLRSISQIENPIREVDYETSADLITYVFEPRDTISTVLQKYGIDYDDIRLILSSSKKYFDLAKVKPLHTLKFCKAGTTLNYLKYYIDDEYMLEVDRRDDRFYATKKKIKYEVLYEAAEGSIFTSLFDSATTVNIPYRVIVDLTEIFSWDIDFNKELRRGDKFKILVEKYMLDNRLVKYGNILMAEFWNNGRYHNAYYYKDNLGRDGYYDFNGQSLKKQFLKSPVKYSRISSRYTNARIHPILKISRAHKGIDYAAPRGTPIRTIGDGRVVEAGWNGGAGIIVKIKHNGTYTTRYCHMSGLARGIRVGAYVKQGQIVGYVGSTGLSTGSHCHFEFIKNGAHVNPNTVKTIASAPIGKAQLNSFVAVRDNYIQTISSNIMIAREK